MSRYWKFLREDGMPTHGTGRWEVGVWRSVDGPIVPCRNGIHACRDGDLFSWLAPALHPIVLDGEIVTQDNKVVARAGCVGPRLAGWNEQTMRLLAADCAAHVIQHNRDPRVTAAIIVARDAAWDAARDAARDAAGDAENAWQCHRLLAYACGGIDLDAERERTARDLPWALKIVGAA